MWREQTRRMLTKFGMEKHESFGRQLRLLNEYDERLTRLRSERR